MKKPDKKKKKKDMRTEYDFTGGVRGKHHRAMQAGYSITVHQEDGTTVTKEVVPRLSKSRNTNAVTCAICYTIQPAIFLL